MLTKNETLDSQEGTKSILECPSGEGKQRRTVNAQAREFYKMLMLQEQMLTHGYVMAKWYTYIGRRREVAIEKQKKQKSHPGASGHG